MSLCHHQVFDGGLVPDHSWERQCLSYYKFMDFCFLQLSFRVKRSKLIAKSQLPESSAVQDDDVMINSDVMSDEEQVEAMGNSSGTLLGVDDVTVDSACDPDRVYGEEETDTSGAENDGSCDQGAEFTSTTADDTSAATTGVKKVKIAGLYKPPTHEELQTLKETQNLFKSNLMRLQVTYDNSLTKSTVCDLWQSVLSYW